mmetsp:Transcript_79989/g.151093  ORF Transcript_79989/g.151093 Transcript_79989/m.151093 type:complete len:244 (+) Transcript_79989:705-1436(+)
MLTPSETLDLFSLKQPAFAFEDAHPPKIWAVQQAVFVFENAHHPQTWARGDFAEAAVSYSFWLAHQIHSQNGFSSSCHNRGCLGDAWKASSLSSYCSAYSCGSYSCSAHSCCAETESCPGSAGSHCETLIAAASCYPAHLQLCKQNQAVGSCHQKAHPRVQILLSLRSCHQKVHPRAQFLLAFSPMSCWGHKAPRTAHVLSSPTPCWVSSHEAAQTAQTLSSLMPCSASSHEAARTAQVLSRS